MHHIRYTVGTTSSELRANDADIVSRSSRWKRSDNSYSAVCRRQNTSPVGTIASRSRAVVSYNAPVRLFIALV